MTMRKALVIGGSNGIGLAVAEQLKRDHEVFVLDLASPDPIVAADLKYEPFDITNDNFSILDKYQDIDSLFITVGFGKLSLFKDILEEMIPRYFNVNTIGIIRVIKHFYSRLLAKDDFHCGVMVSIAGFMSSPFFSLYGASKAALKIFIESVNVELEKEGTTNRILNVSPGTIKGTRFNGGQNDLSQTESLAKEIVDHLQAKDDLFIPKYEEIFKEVLERYHKDFRKEGLHSYEYKLESGRMNKQ